MNLNIIELPGIDYCINSSFKSTSKVFPNLELQSKVVTLNTLLTIEGTSTKGEVSLTAVYFPYNLSTGRGRYNSAIICGLGILAYNRRYYLCYLVLTGFKIDLVIINSKNSIQTIRDIRDIEKTSKRNGSLDIDNPIISESVSDIHKELFMFIIQDIVKRRQKRLNDIYDTIDNIEKFINQI